MVYKIIKDLLIGQGEFSATKRTTMLYLSSPTFHSFSSYMFVIASELQTKLAIIFVIQKLKANKSIWTEFFKRPSQLIFKGHIGMEESNTK